MGAPVPWRSGWALPARIRATADDPDAPFLVTFEVVTRNREPHIDRVAFEARPGGRPVSSRQIRQIRLATYVRLAVNEARLVVEDLGNGSFRISPRGWPLGEEAPLELLSDDRPHRRGRRRVTDDDVRRAADAYLRARASGEWPRKAVEEELGVSPATASRRIKMAQDQGLIPEKGEE